MSVTNVPKAQPVSLGAMWRDKKIRGIIMQIIAIIGVLLFFTWLVNNAVVNLNRLNVEVGFDFLWNTASYDIGQTLIPYSAADTHFRAGLVGLLNTLLVAVCGVILATILGFSAGIARLSNNFVVSRLMQVYVEVARNTPVLLQILLFYGIIINSLPSVRTAEALIEGVIITNRGLYLPQPVPLEGFGWVWIALFAGIAFAIFFKGYAKRVLDTTGKQLPVFLVGLGVIILLPVLAYFIMGQPLDTTWPVFKGFNFVGGFVIRPEFLALWLALSIYTGAFIAEVVRAGIMSVSHGQSEAANALGIKASLTMKLVVIPQAMRVIIPPLISQFLNLTKNSSLAIAIGYMDLVATLGGITLTQSGRAIESMGIILLTYLTISLVVSSIMNAYNKRVALVER